MARDNYSKDTPAADLYIAGFPCQPFSAAGTLTALTALNPSRGSVSGMSEMIVFVGSHARKYERLGAGSEVVLVAFPCSESRPSLSNRQHGLAWLSQPFLSNTARRQRAWFAGCAWYGILRMQELYRSQETPCLGF